jgi:hypothetical protein
MRELAKTNSGRTSSNTDHRLYDATGRTSRWKMTRVSLSVKLFSRRHPSNQNYLDLAAMLSLDCSGLDLSLPAAIVPQDDLF